MMRNPSADSTTTLAVRGPTCDREREALDAFFLRHPDVATEWFDARDDEDLGHALGAGRFGGCLFADRDAAIDTAIGGNSVFAEIQRCGLDFRLATQQESSDEHNRLELSDVLYLTEAIGRRRREAASRRQTIAATIFSAIFLLASATLIALGP